MDKTCVWERDFSFYESVYKYGKWDGVCAIVLFLTMCGLYVELALLSGALSFINEHILLVGCMFNALIIGLTIGLVKIKGESLASVGLFGGNWKKSVGFGGFLAAIYFVNNCLSHILAGASLVPVKDIFVLTVYYFLVSFSEEIVFRGYIATRLYGFIKNKYFAWVLTGILFVLMHFPYRMIAYDMSIMDLTVGNIRWIVDLFVTHTLFTFISKKTNSLWGAVLPHWMSNLAYNIVAR